MGKAKEHSFDITGEINRQELKNAVEQSRKEVATRFDFKDVTKDIEYTDGDITLVSNSENKVDSLWDVLTTKAIKRDVPLNAFEKGKYEPSAGGNIKLVIKVKDSLTQDNAKKLVKDIKEINPKIQSSIMGDSVRVVSKSIDELQEIMSKLKAKELDFPINFKNLK